MPPPNTGFDQKAKTTCMHLLGEHNCKQPEGFVHGRLSSHWGSESWIGPLCFHFTHCNALAYSKARKSSRFEIPHLGITSHSISVVPPPEIVTLWPQLGCHDSWHILLNGGAMTINIFNPPVPVWPTGSRSAHLILETSVWPATILLNGDVSSDAGHSHVSISL